jgi:hypothetical protein
MKVVVRHKGQLGSSAAQLLPSKEEFNKFIQSFYEQCFVLTQTPARDVQKGKDMSLAEVNNIHWLTIRNDLDTRLEET